MTTTAQFATPLRALDGASLDDVPGNASEGVVARYGPMAGIAGLALGGTSALLGWDLRQTQRDLAAVVDNHDERIEKLEKRTKKIAKSNREMWENLGTFVNQQTEATARLKEVAQAAANRIEEIGVDVGGQLEELSERQGRFESSVLDQQAAFLQEATRKLEAAYLQSGDPDAPAAKAPPRKRAAPRSRAKAAEQKS